jgi:hypothetical protein
VGSSLGGGLFGGAGSVSFSNGVLDGGVCDFVFPSLYISRAYFPFPPFFSVFFFFYLPISPSLSLFSLSTNFHFPLLKPVPVGGFLTETEFDFPAGQ